MTQTRLEITRRLHAPIEDVFDAWTDPSLMSRWFFVGDGWTAQVESRLEVGGTFRITMVTQTGETLECHGTYQKIERPRRLVFTWNSHFVTDSVVTVELGDLDNATELKLTHEGLIDPAIRDRHARGWHGCLAHLQKVLPARFH